MAFLPWGSRKEYRPLLAQIAIDVPRTAHDEPRATAMSRVTRLAKTDRGCMIGNPNSVAADEHLQ
jgi:hypothetical protein